MLAAQSSLAESVDGDELRSDDGEERRSDRPTADYYCLYLYQTGGVPQDPVNPDEGSPGSSGADTPPGEDFSLSMVDTNLPAEAEPDLRNFMAKRLSRGAMFEGMGNVASVDLSHPECSLGCYYCVIQQRGHPEAGSHSSEHLVCFLGGSEKGLDLFRLELDRYVEELKTKIQMGNLDSDIRPHLSSWFEVSILPIQRIVNLFQEKLSYLLHAALSYTTVEVTNSDERTKNDVRRFLSSASLQGLVHEGTMASLCIAMTEKQHHTVTVDFSDGQPELLNAVTDDGVMEALPYGKVPRGHIGNQSPGITETAGETGDLYRKLILWNTLKSSYDSSLLHIEERFIQKPEAYQQVSNRFCEDWMQVFISSFDGGNPFLFRQKLENFKLKAIQDMNSLKRLIRQAESSHHALFRCYNFLKNCGNGDLLLQMVKVEHAEMPEASSVVTVLEEFIQEEGFSVHSS